MNPRDFKLNLVDGRLHIRWTETQTRRDLQDGAVATKEEACAIELSADATAIVAGLLHPERGLTPAAAGAPSPAAAGRPKGR